MWNFVRFFYFSVRGRISRRFYWLFGFVPLLVAGLVLALVLLAAQPDPSAGSPLLLFVAAVFAVWAGIAIYAKRLHDIGLSAWWIAIPLSLYMVVALFVSPPAARLLSFVVWIVLGLITGTKGANKFGPDPTRSREQQLDQSVSAA